jgi:MHS family proline/betaine transporter-like MFS transporter
LATISEPQIMNITNSDIASESSAAARPIVQSRKQLIGAMMGNVLEYYDFIVYSFLAATLGRKFFQGDDVTGLLASFATFGVGFLARPLGGAIIGRIGDRLGRRTALQITIFGMALGTVGIGVLPTYASIGLAAPICLVVLRLIQGLSTGGEWGTATSFIVESAPEGKRGWYGGLGQASIAAASMLSSAVVAVMTNVFSPSEMDSWAWRLPFLLGGLIVVVGIYMRRTLQETPAFIQAREEGQYTEASANDNKSGPSAFKMMAISFGFSIIWTVSYYVMLVYMPTFLTRQAGLTQAQGLTLNTIALLALVFATTFFGWLSDRIGRKPLLLACCVVFIVFPYPLFHIILSHPGLGVILGIQIFFNLFIGAFSGAGPAAMCEMFPTTSRTTLLSFSYSVAAAIFGGFAPFIATALIQHTGSSISPVYYLIAAALVSGMVIIGMKETAHSKLK